MSEIEFQLDELERVCTDLEVCNGPGKKGAQRILVQLPGGLKRRAFEICNFIEKRTGASVILQGESTYGACDLGHGFETIGIDAVVHFGHSVIPEMGLPVKMAVPFYFMEVTLQLDAGMIAGNICSFLETAHPGLERIALFAPVQYVGQLPGIAAALEKGGMAVSIPGGDRRVAYPGQILGCNFSAARAIPDNERNANPSNERNANPSDGKNANPDTGLIFIGTGNFHPLGLALSTGLPVIAADPATGELRIVNTERFLRQRHGAIAAARGAGSFAVLVSTKAGQHRERLAEHLVELLRKSGKTTCVITMDHIDPGALRYLPADVLVNTACPRISIDDYGRFLDAGKTIITPYELEVVLGLREWGEYVMDEIVEGKIEG